MEICQGVIYHIQYGIPASYLMDVESVGPSKRKMWQGADKKSQNSTEASRPGASPEASRCCPDSSSGYLLIRSKMTATMSKALGGISLDRG